jgi:hypothetical protein
VRKKIILWLPYSIIIGMTLTLLFMWKASPVFSGNCVNYDPRFSNIRRVDCAGQNYGYPIDFIQAEGHVDVNTLDTSKTSPILLGQSSAIRLKPINLILDAALWSAASLVILTLLASLYEPHSKKITKKLL